MAADKSLQSRMQRYSVVTGVKLGIAQCVQISEARYQFLSSKEAEDIAWYCKSCKQPAMVAVLENKSIEDKVKKHTEKINQKIKVIECNLHKKAESTEFEKLQKSRRTGKQDEESTRQQPRR